MFELSRSMKLVECATPDVVYYRRIRQGSASQNQSLSYRLKNQSRLILKYCKIYFKNPQKFNISFFLTRLLGAVKCIIAN